MKKFLLALSVFSGYAFSSMIGIDALGEEQVTGGTTSAAARGFAGNAKTGDAEGLSVVNPARLAFDAKVVFNLNFAMEMEDARKNGHHYSVSNLSSVPTQIMLCESCATLLASAPAFKPKPFTKATAGLAFGL